MPAFYRATVAELLADEPQRILGTLTSGAEHSGFAELQRRQIKAWQREIDVLKVSLAELLTQFAPASQWSVLLEYPIPRRRKRLDTVVLAGEIVFCVEFKTEDRTHSLAARRQAEDYALDLRDFHEASRNRIIQPIVVVPKAPATPLNVSTLSDTVRAVQTANASDFAQIMLACFAKEHKPCAAPMDAAAWDKSPYRPVPTIIEAAEALYAGHNVREIAHSHAGAINLTMTSDALVDIIRDAQKRSEKVVCFVTGVPGAGKTLAGLNVVHNPALRGEGRSAGVFLSGNGPLVKIVSAAIARDHRRRARIRGAERTVPTLVQNVHEFVREGLDKPDQPPVEHVVVFDEAQRAWNAQQNLKKSGLEISEPETMLSIMDRHLGWAVLIALVGGGQEIHSGEAGLAEWGRALRVKFPHWKIAVSPKALHGDTSVAGHRLFSDRNAGSIVIAEEPALHLEVNLRSFRAKRLAEWVDAVLAGQAEQAAAIAPDLRDFPVGLTRSLAKVKAWLGERTRGRRRCGLVASSGALRLRAEGVELSSGFRQGNRDLYVHWFLDEPPDIRSSNQLEVAASEFECQGLELDWVGVCWGGDLTFDVASEGWVYRSFSGSRWGHVGSEVDRQYLLNSYRVLLTRAREGLVIWVPHGDVSDETRPPAWFEETAGYLQRCGLPVV